jgi:hypothetical protein
MRIKAVAALLVVTIAASGVARADGAETAEPLRLLPPKPGIWEQRTEITYTGPDADHPGETAHESCALAMPIQSNQKLIWDGLIDGLPRRFNPMRFTANTPSHAAAYRIETHVGTIAKRLKIEGGAWSSATDIRRIGDREYLLTASTTSSRFGKWTYTKRETTHVRWLMEKEPPIDPSEIDFSKATIDIFHPSNPCKTVGTPKGRIDFDGADFASALLTPPG